MTKAFPIPVLDLIPALPHRPPMVWIDEVHLAGTESGSCAINLSHGRLDIDDDGYCLPFAPVEWVAEAFGYSRACRALGDGATIHVKRALLVGVVSFELLRRIAAVGRIFVDWQLKRELSSLAIIDGTIRRNDDILAKVQIKVFFEA